MKNFFKILEFIGVIFILFGATILVVWLSSKIKYQENPCEKYADELLNNVPAKCHYYFD